MLALWYAWLGYQEYTGKCAESIGNQSKEARESVGGHLQSLYRKLTDLFDKIMTSQIATMHVYIEPCKKDGEPRPPSPPKSKMSDRVKTPDPPKLNTPEPAKQGTADPKPQTTNKPEPAKASTPEPLKPSPEPTKFNAPDPNNYKIPEQPKTPEKPKTPEPIITPEPLKRTSPNVPEPPKTVIPSPPFSKPIEPIKNVTPDYPNVIPPTPETPATPGTPKTSKPDFDPMAFSKPATHKQAVPIDEFLAAERSSPVAQTFPKPSPPQSPLLKPLKIPTPEPSDDDEDAIADLDDSDFSGEDDTQEEVVNFEKP